MSHRLQTNWIVVKFVGTHLKEVSRTTFSDDPNVNLAVCPQCGRVVEYALRDVRFPGLEWGSACVQCPECELNVPVTLPPY